MPEIDLLLFVCALNFNNDVHLFLSVLLQREEREVIHGEASQVRTDYNTKKILIGLNVSCIPPHTVTEGIGMFCIKNLLNV